MCLALVLRSQEQSTWSKSATHKFFSGLLAFAAHKRPRVCIVQVHVITVNVRLHL